MDKEEFLAYLNSILRNPKNLKSLEFWRGCRDAVSGNSVQDLENQVYLSGYTTCSTEEED